MRQGERELTNPASIEEGAYYEAHQQLRVVSQRYVKAKDYSAAIEILSSGAQALLKAGQGGSGCDLCLLMIEVFKTSNSSPTAALKGEWATDSYVYSYSSGLAGLRGICMDGC